ncbi:MAG: hypothetical protein QNK30_14080 [Bacteroidales bacterium]|nr:hypothetical protein [Bacteroidales bacterium]
MIIISSCSKDDISEVENNNVPTLLDSILYVDIDPDTTLHYTYDTTFDDNGIELIRGEFTYKIDINNDDIFDFEIAGKKWPGFYHEDGYWKYFDTTYIVGFHAGSIIYRQPSSCIFCPCDVQPMIDEEIIDGNMRWRWVQHGTINYDSNEGGCYWDYKQGNNYIPIRLRLENKSYYGWLDIDGAINPIIKSFAINLRPEKPIQAGQKE